MSNSKTFFGISMAIGLMLTLTAGQAWSRPAMSVLTVNTKDPAAYLQWVQGSGEAIAESIDAAVGGICVPSAGFYGPGELYYWHLFGDHATALGSEQYNPTVMKELKKLKADRVVSWRCLQRGLCGAGGLCSRRYLRQLEHCDIEQ